ncbi:MAG: AraC family transcriptional regulator [Muribaculaceae bacterium]|nr:AraC family transcriptional regulator [Roseburia sp.]MCM1430153.1 AraC family transcriptional regulator [Muribaculaceae bacterium]MCM1493084.1 AraC family transcriptional regulator [Muribaculaceae bacterium]
MNDSFFNQLTLTSGLIGEQSFQENLRRLISFPMPQTENDGLLHLLAQGEYSFASGCRFVFDAKPCSHLYYIYEGRLSLTTEGRSVSAEAGQFLFFFTEAAMDCEPSHCRYYHACIAGEALPLYRKHIRLCTDASLLRSGVSCVPERIRQLMDCKMADEADVLKCSKWLTDILTELALYAMDSTRRSGQAPAYIRQMKELFDLQYARDFSLEELELEFDISKYRLCREFSKYNKISPFKYLNRRRIGEAKRLLLTTELPVHEIGAMVGMENTNHFINLFKRETGATPLVFRQEAPSVISGLHYPCTPDGRPQ